MPRVFFFGRPATPRLGGATLNIGRSSSSPEAWAYLPNLLPLLAEITPGLMTMADDSLQATLAKAHASCDHVPYSPPR